VAWTEGNIGASVYSELGTRVIPVGSNTTHTVYAAELVGIDTALNQILAHQDAFSDVNPILTDNQAAEGHLGSTLSSTLLKRSISATGGASPYGGFSATWERMRSVDFSS
jgi:hypothetical protein